MLRCFAYAFCQFAAVAVLAAASVGDAPGNAVARPATDAEVSLLNALLQKTAADFRRWAYTEHRVIKDEKGRVKSEVLHRHDPSLPYAEQWKPIKIDGREPTERERTKYRRRGEAASKGEGERSRSGQRITLGESIDVARSSVAAETPTHLWFEIPLMKMGNERFPPEKFQVIARIRKDGEVLENIAVRLRESFRAKLLLKVKSGDASLDFEAVNPKYPATLVSVTGDASASVLFVSVGGSVELRRTEIKHVKPFDERFEVQIGTLKAIDF